MLYPHTSLVTITYTCVISIHKGTIKESSPITQIKISRSDKNFDFLKCV